jgi:hypothetical protein
MGPQKLEESQVAHARFVFGLQVGGQPLGRKLRVLAARVEYVAHT